MTREPVEGDAREELRGRLKWFLFGRVAAISAFLGVLALLYLRSGQEEYVVSVNRLLLIVIATYLFSAVSAVALPRIRRLRPFTYVQVAYDIALITGVVLLTGGLNSPFPFLYSLPIINAAGLLFGRGALVTAFMAATAYGSLIAALSTGWFAGADAFGPHRFDLNSGMRLATNNTTFFLIAYLAAVLTRRMRKMERLMIERRDERDRLAVLQDTLARAIATGLMTTDAQGILTSVNAVGAELARKEVSELMGCNIGAVFPPLRLNAGARRRFLQSTEASQPIEFSCEKNHGGAPSQIRAVAAPLRDTYGHFVGALYILQDVSRLKAVENAVPPTRDAKEIEDLWRRGVAEAEEIAEAADGLFGTSREMRRVRDWIGRVARSDATVLLGGESGTGKELVAQSIHARSERRGKPFIVVNCGAIPEQLIESELFGHVRGAFTGAIANRAGCFRAADSGTIFLDEIGDLPLHLQVKLLRVLQERVFRPVGGETNVAVNVRIVAATNKDLAAEIAAGRFREDLFFRLNVVSIKLPPLRERRDDIPLLVRHFLRHFSGQHGRRVARLSVQAGRVLLEYDYPGNVRELENIVEHAVALCDGETATEEHLPRYLVDGSGARREPPAPAAENPRSSWVPPAPSGPTIDLDRDLAAYEKAILVRALQQAGGVKKRAAELLGINYRSLRHRLQKYGLGEAAGRVAVRPAD